MGYLEELREDIDNIDKQLVELFEKRMKIVVNVAKYKKENNVPILNTSREKEVIDKNISYLKDKSIEVSLKDFFNNLMSVSRDYQRKQINSYKEIDYNKEKGINGEPKLKKEKLNVAFQGVIGSFSEQALSEYFGKEVNVHPVKQFEDVLKKLNDDDIDYGVLPIENSSTGAITEVYDLLREYGFFIVGNTCVKVEHNLLGVKGTKIEDIEEVYSHIQAFKQSNEFLSKHSNWKLIPYYNTAISAEMVKNEDCKYKAAIGSRKAAEVYGLDIIEPNINYNCKNYTRFIIVGKNLEINNDSDTISIVISTPHRAGGLYESLKFFAENNLNMMRIESRPIIDKPWEYFFYIDFQGNLNDEVTKKAVDLIKKNSNYFKILGNYKDN